VSKLLESGQVCGRLSLINLREQRKAIVKNWEDSGLLDGLEGHVKENVAQLYESHASAMLDAGVTFTVEADFNYVEIYKLKYDVNIGNKDYRSAQFNLTKMIHAMQDELFNKYCA
jgi:hypothetical protein